MAKDFFSFYFDIDSSKYKKHRKFYQFALFCWILFCILTSAILVHTILKYNGINFYDDSFNKINQSSYDIKEFLKIIFTLLVITIFLISVVDKYFFNIPINLYSIIWFLLRNLVRIIKPKKISILSKIIHSIEKKFFIEIFIKSAKNSLSVRSVTLGKSLIQIHKNTQLINKNLRKNFFYLTDSQYLSLFQEIKNDLAEKTKNSPYRFDISKSKIPSFFFEDNNKNSDLMLIYSNIVNRLQRPFTPLIKFLKESFFVVDLLFSEFIFNFIEAISINTENRYLEKHDIRQEFSQYIRGGYYKTIDRDNGGKTIWPISFSHINSLIRTFFSSTSLNDIYSAFKTNFSNFFSAKVNSLIYNKEKQKINKNLLIILFNEFMRLIFKQDYFSFSLLNNEFGVFCKLNLPYFKSLNNIPIFKNILSMISMYKEFQKWINYGALLTKLPFGVGTFLPSRPVLERACSKKIKAFLSTFRAVTTDLFPNLRAFYDFINHYLTPANGVYRFIEDKMRFIEDKMEKIEKYKKLFVSFILPLCEGFIDMTSLLTKLYEVYYF